jgi:hypothetical protein
MEPKQNLTPCQEKFDSNELWKEGLSSQRDRLIMLARSPRSALVYWEWTKGKSDFFEKGGFAPEVTITLFRADTRVAVGNWQRRWDDLRFYCEPPKPGYYYCAALTINTAAGQPHARLESNTIFIPRGGETQELTAVSSTEMMRSRFSI